MNIHKNARLTPLRREEMALSVIEGGLSQAHAALKFAVTAKAVKRWWSATRWKAVPAWPTARRGHTARVRPTRQWPTGSWRCGADLPMSFSSD